jgi:hypothetical protein
MWATWRMYVDLPAMFGPVITRICLSPVSSRQSLGTNAPAGTVVSTTGCRPSATSIASPSSTTGRT